MRLSENENLRLKPLRVNLVLRRVCDGTLQIFHLSLFYDRERIG